MKEICQHYSLGLHFKITHCSAIYIVDSEKQEFICHWQLIVWKTVALFIKNLKKKILLKAQIQFSGVLAQSYLGHRSLCLIPMVF